jgi:hypothetical protein
MGASRSGGGLLTRKVGLFCEFLKNFEFSVLCFAKVSQVTQENPRKIADSCKTQKKIAQRNFRTLPNNEMTDYTNCFIIYSKLIFALSYEKYINIIVVVLASLI